MILGIHNLSSEPVYLKGRVSGIVTDVLGNLKKRIMIQNRYSLEYVASTHSDEEGKWSIANIPEFPKRMLIGFAFDDTSNKFNAEIIDFITTI
jgi:hypothetical protein